MDPLVQVTIIIGAQSKESQPSLLPQYAPVMDRGEVDALIEKQDKSGSAARMGTKYSGQEFIATQQ